MFALSLTSCFNIKESEMKKKKKNPFNKAEYIEKQIVKRQEKQALIRRRRSMAIMRDYPGQYRCTTCTHGKTGNCVDQLPNGCEHYYNAANGREFQAKAC